MEKSSGQKLILITQEPDGIAWITINRPKSLNSLTKSMIIDLARIFKSLDADDSVRVIILTGSGRSFCSGVDLTAAEDVFKGDVKDIETDPVAQMERCRKPIIGAIDGFAVTAGFEISLACDLLVASKDAKFLDTHARSLTTYHGCRQLLFTFGSCRLRMTTTTTAYQDFDGLSSMSSRLLLSFHVLPKSDGILDALSPS
ncbi:putative huntingtin-interacting protein K-like isoform 1 [Capsicum annuum]|nr:putative huntingtin-interacting protein K-like isoform 1 [Capsicum annuum]